MSLICFTICVVSNALANMEFAGYAAFIIACLVILAGLRACLKII